MTPERPFAEPWQAELFALTVTLSEAGQFTWVTWTEAFGATLRRHGAARDLDGGDDYYAAWLETLEGLLDAAGLAPKSLAADMKMRWEAAYLATPHGQPVRIADQAVDT